MTTVTLPNKKYGGLLLISALLFLGFLGSAHATAVGPTVDSQMLFYYRMNSSDNATYIYDAGQYKNNATGNATFVSSDGILSDGSYFFNSSDTNYFNVTNPNMMNGTTNFSAIGWFYNGSLASRIFSMRDAGGIHWTLGIDGTGHLSFDNSGLNDTTVSSTATYSGKGHWQMASAVYNLTHICIYINGTFLKCDGVTGTLNISSTNLFIGRDYNGLNKMLGKLDELILYNRSLSATEINNTYNHYVNICGSQPIDNCIINNVTTFDTGTYQLNDAALNGAIQFNANNIYLDCAGSTIVGNFTGSNTNVGIRTFSFNNVTIKNCIFKNYYEGLLIGNTENNIYINNVTTNNTNYGIYVGQVVSNITIANSTFINSSFAAIYSPSPTSGAASGINNFEITLNNFTNTISRGIYVWGKNASSFNNNITIQRNVYDMLGGGQMNLKYTTGITIQHESYLGNRTLFSSPIQTINVSNVDMNNLTIDRFQYGMYYIRDGKELVSNAWVCTEESRNVTIRNSVIKNNDIGVWYDAVRSGAIIDNQFINNTNNVDGYNAGVFIGVCSDTISVARNNFSQQASKGIYGVGTSRISVVNNSFDYIPIANRSSYSANDLLDFPVAISFEELYVSYPQTNYTPYTTDAPLSFVTSLASSNITLSGNTFDNDTQIFLKGENMTGLTHDLTGYVLRSFQIPTNFIDRTLMFINSNVTTLQSYSGGSIKTDSQISYRKITFKDNYSYTSDYTRFVNIQSNETHQINLYNLTNALIYFNNLSAACTDINSCDGNVNGTLTYLNTTYLLDNYAVNQSAAIRARDPISVTNTSANIRALTSTLTSTLTNVSVTLATGGIVPSSPLLVHTDGTSEYPSYLYDSAGGRITFNATIKPGVNSLFMTVSDLSLQAYPQQACSAGSNCILLVRAEGTISCSYTNVTIAVQDGTSQIMSANSLTLFQSSDDNCVYVAPAFLPTAAGTYTVYINYTDSRAIAFTPLQLSISMPGAGAGSSQTTTSGGGGGAPATSTTTILPTLSVAGCETLPGGCDVTEQSAAEKATAQYTKQQMMVPLAIILFFMLLAGALVTWKA